MFIWPVPKQGAKTKEIKGCNYRHQRHYWAAFLSKMFDCVALPKKDLIDKIWFTTIEMHFITNEVEKISFAVEAAKKWEKTCKSVD